MIDMTLKKARGISYSQLYPNGKDTIGELLKGLPTCDSVCWIAFIIAKKESLKVGEFDLHIIMPNLFELNNELQHRVTGFMGSYVNKNDLYINVPALLDVIVKLLEKPNLDRHDLDKNEKSKLFKAYLIACDNYLADGTTIINDNFGPSDILQTYMPWALQSNSSRNVITPMMELYKGKRLLIDFVPSNDKIKTFVEEFLHQKHCKNASEYLWNIYTLSTDLMFNNTKTCLIKFGEETNKSVIEFYDSLCVNTTKDYGHGAKINIQEYPLFKVDKDTYCVLFSKFLIDKLYHSMIFDIAESIEKAHLLKGTSGEIYIQLKKEIGEHFTEQYLFYPIINHILKDKRYIKETGDELKAEYGNGMPDYFARKAERIFIFEFKDVQLTSKVKKSDDFDIIIDKLNEKFVANEKGKPKGVSQLANVIVNKLDKIKGIEDDEHLTVFPVLVYTDSSFDEEGINYHLNNKFREALPKTDIAQRIKVKDLVMVNLDSLFMFEKAFVDGKLKFDVLLNNFISYKDSKPEYNVVPFNKFLFQTGKKRGYFFKTPYLAKDTLEELKRINNE